MKDRGGFVNTGLLLQGCKLFVTGNSRYIAGDPTKEVTELFRQQDLVEKITLVQLKGTTIIPV
jgi:hypothetical protein